jgi:hypothetical protein
MVVREIQSDRMHRISEGTVQAQFIAVPNRAGSLFFRYQPRIVAVLELDQDEVTISVGGSSACFRSR